MGFDTYRYYHPDLNRDASRDLLRDNGKGSYLIRPSSRRGCLSLSVHAEQRIAHFLIFVTGDDNEEEYQLDPKAWSGHEIKGSSFKSLHALLRALAKQRHMAATFRRGIPCHAEKADQKIPYHLYTDPNLEFPKSAAQLAASGDDERDYADAGADADIEDGNFGDDDIDGDDEYEENDVPAAPMRSVKQFSPDSEMDVPRKQKPSASASASAPAAAAAPSESSSSPKLRAKPKSMRRKQKCGGRSPPVAALANGTNGSSSAPPLKPQAPPPEARGRQARGMPPSPAEVRANDHATKMTEYKGMLSMAVANESISATELQKLSAWRQKKNFSSQMHSEALALLHITPEEFDAMKNLQADSAPPKSEVCVVCMDKPRDCVVMPCAHMHTCHDCGSNLTDCPVCREKIVKVVKIYK